MELIIKNVRLAFFDGYEPSQKYNNYGAKLIIAPNHPQIAQIEKVMRDVARDKYGPKWETIYKDMENKDRLCFRRKEYTDSKGVVPVGFEGMHYLACSSPANKPPLCLKRDKTISQARDGELYGGCYADVKLEIWPQPMNSEWGTRINAQPLVFQKRADGDAFAGGPPPSADGMDDLSDVGETVDDMIG